MAEGGVWSRLPKVRPQLHGPGLLCISQSLRPPSHSNKAARTGWKRKLHNHNPMGPQNQTTHRSSPGTRLMARLCTLARLPTTHTRADLAYPETGTPPLAMAVSSHSPVAAGRRVGAAQAWRLEAQRPGCLPARPVLCPAPRGMLGRAWWAGFRWVHS